MSRPTTSRSVSRPKSSASTSAPAPVAHHSRSPSPPPPPAEYSMALPALTPTQLRLLEKQQEHAGLQALKEASGALVARVEELARMGNVMADGGEAVGSVLRNWPLVFSILNLHEHPTQQKPAEQGDASRESADESRRQEEEDKEGKPLPQLVRLEFTEG